MRPPQFYMSGTDLASISETLNSFLSFVRRGAFNRKAVAAIQERPIAQDLPLTANIFLKGQRIFS